MSRPKRKVVREFQSFRNEVSQCLRLECGHIVYRWRRLRPYLWAECELCADHISIDIRPSPRVR